MLLLLMILLFWYSFNDQCVFGMSALLGVALWCCVSVAIDGCHYYSILLFRRLTIDCVHNWNWWLTWCCYWYIDDDTLFIILCYYVYGIVQMIHYVVDVMIFLDDAIWWPDAVLIVEHCCCSVFWRLISVMFDEPLCAIDILYSLLVVMWSDSDVIRYEVDDWYSTFCSSIIGIILIHSAIMYSLFLMMFPTLFYLQYSVLEILMEWYTVVILVGIVHFVIDDVPFVFYWWWRCRAVDDMMMTLTVILLLSTFVDGYILIVVDSGDDIVTVPLVLMHSVPSVFFCDGGWVTAFISVIPWLQLPYSDVKWCSSVLQWCTFDMIDILLMAFILL